MEEFATYLRIAGVLQLLVASANFFAARMFRYRESLSGVPRHVVQVFVAQNVFIVLTVVGMAALCLGSPHELTDGSSLARGLTGFLTIFWGTRLAFHLFFYDRELRRQHRMFDILFLLTFAYLTLVFAIGASTTW